MGLTPPPSSWQAQEHRGGQNSQVRSQFRITGRSQKPRFQEPRFIICIKAVQCGPWEFCAACVDPGILSENSEDSHPSPTHGPGENPVLSKATRRSTRAQWEPGHRAGAGTGLSKGSSIM